ncbi:MAG: Predicted signal-transduction protein containing cAMP-binding and CBS domains [uncultured Sulfurovum sp.]|uniref:Predicted signal-transduction protein containing cAMP-binding and CBS domains n=1 Tax=uncultured Sulfurovum sp. TaxID=269237 RepID=A0A6S6U5L4_9BACT|nr:MAG: Predicted signal-transduction protein containing cAMP-binding and CBS domains [uncultured Sulfurovum sp.]
MSLHSQEIFIKEIHPFENLSQFELDMAFKHMDIAYYPIDTVLISPQSVSEYFFIIIKGEVKEFCNDELTFVYHEQDTFDADSLIYSKTKSKFIVSEELICYELKKSAFMKIMSLNKKFESFFLNNLSSRFQTLKNKEYGSEISSFMVGRVSDAYMHVPCIVEVNTSIKEAIEKSLEDEMSSIIVQRGNEYGIVTDSNIKKGVLLAGKPLTDPIEDIATFPLICVEKDAFLFSVLLLLLKHNIKRVGVLEEGKIIGVLNQMDMLSFFANHSHVVAVKIDKAKNIDELRNASDDVNKTIKSLYNKSLKTAYIAKMVSELNTKIYEKLFSFVVPEEMQAQCALLVMGSEGRDAQIVKTDQDNALVVSNDADVEAYRPYMEQFTKELISFGFPPCDGNIMVSNPYWCKNQSDFDQQIEQWFEGNNMDYYMHLAIFFDAKCVAGDCNLLVPLKEKVFELAHQKDVFMAYFAKNTLLFETPINMFSSLRTEEGGVDIKKGGIFAIVQGIRSLALENALTENTTVKRIKALHKKGVLEKDMSSELIEALGLLSRLRLQGHIEKQKAGEKVNNILNVSEFSKIERDMLKDSFTIVNDFKKFISRHFRLGQLQ